MQVFKGNFVLPDFNAFLLKSIFSIKKVKTSQIICPFFIGAIQI